tara:strand:+ start:9353 stop:9757 length:405 start_codon:yes stop_codon:yes gene_type:complete
MLKSITQSKILSWQEVDSYLNAIADNIFLQSNNEKVISYTDVRDRIPAAILSEKLGYNLVNTPSINDNHFSIFCDSNRCLQNNLSANMFCFYFLSYELDSEYLKKRTPRLSIEEFDIPNGETVFKLSLPWDPRW